MKIRQKTIVDQVMDHLKKLISDGIYAPGDKIPTEQELAQEFGVGRSSIREAIKIFNYLGVMESKSARGTYICKRAHISTEAITWALLLGNDELESIIELRGAIELWSFIRLTMLNKTEPEKVAESIIQLEKQLTKMETVIAENGNKDKLIDADYDFHFEIIKGGNNPLFIELYQLLKTFMINEIKKTQDKYTSTRKIFEEHHVLLEAVKSGNIQKAEETYIDHISNIKNLMDI